MRQISPKRAQRNRREAVVKKVIRQRANGLCEDCGKPPDWRGLAVAHRVFASKGQASGALTLENGRALCYKCHNEHDHGLREIDTQPRWTKDIDR